MASLCSQDQPTVPWSPPNALASPHTGQLASFSTWDLPGSSSQSFCKMFPGGTFLLSLFTYLSPTYLSGKAFPECLSGCSPITEFYIALVMVKVIFIYCLSKLRLWGREIYSLPLGWEKEEEGSFQPPLTVLTHSCPWRSNYLVAL